MNKIDKIRTGCQFCGLYGITNTTGPRIDQFLNDEKSQKRGYIGIRIGEN